MFRSAFIRSLAIFLLGFIIVPGVMAFDNYRDGIFLGYDGAVEQLDLIQGRINDGHMIAQRYTSISQRLQEILHHLINNQRALLNKQAEMTRQLASLREQSSSEDQTVNTVEVPTIEVVDTEELSSNDEDLEKMKREMDSLQRQMIILKRYVRNQRKK